MNGSTVCRVHGGAAPQTQLAARVRLENAADRMARELLKMAIDENVSDSVKLTAIRDALDRGGVGAKAEVDVSISAKPFEQIINNLDSGSRSEFRRSMGIEVDEEPQQISIGFPSCEYDDDDDELIVDGEVVEFEHQDDGQPFTPDDQDRGSAFDSEPGTGVFGPSGPPPNQGMVPLADAVTQAADMRRSAVLRPITRALPRADHEI